MTTFLEQKKKKKVADRGKTAENAVRKYLDRWKKSDARFDFERKYDARSARGRAQPQTGDFGWYWAGTHGVIEVKEVDHEYRLPSKNFSPESRGRLTMRELAGGKVAIVVYHTPIDAWRLLTLAAVKTQVPSWDLRTFETFPSAQAVLDRFFAERNLR